MESTKIIAGIVSYNPNLEELKKNIDSITSQVNGVVLFDNGSRNQKDIIQEFGSRITILLSDVNIGIAAALNRLMEFSKKENAEWMLSLDQDSVCSIDFVKNISKYFSIDKHLGIVAPVIVDRTSGIVGHNPSETYKNVNTCITSGAFSKISVWEEVGGYDESMFIDSVDFDYCYRIRKAGYKVVQIRDVRLSHKIGDTRRRRFLLWRVKVNNHSAFRKYYIARNNVYYPLKNKLWFHFIRGNLRNIWILIIVVLYEKDKKNKLKSIARGWKAGL